MKLFHGWMYFKNLLEAYRSVDRLIVSARLLYSSSKIGYFTDFLKTHPRLDTLELILDSGAWGYTKKGDYPEGFIGDYFNLYNEISSVMKRDFYFVAMDSINNPSLGLKYQEECLKEATRLKIADNLICVNQPGNFLPEHLQTKITGLGGVAGKPLKFLEEQLVKLKDNKVNLSRVHVFGRAISSFSLLRQYKVYSTDSSNATTHTRFRLLQSRSGTCFFPYDARNTRSFHKLEDHFKDYENKEIFTKLMELNLQEMESAARGIYNEPYDLFHPHAKNTRIEQFIG